MYRFRQVRKVPDGDINMAYVAQTPIRPHDAVTLRDLTKTTPQVRAQVAGTFVAPLTTGTTLADWANGYPHFAGAAPSFPTPTHVSRDIIISNRSIMHPNVGDPRPLFYRQNLPSNIYVVAPDAYDWQNAESPFYVEEMKTRIIKNIKIIDELGNPDPRVYFDISVTAFDSITSDGYPLYNIVFYSNIRSEDEHTYFLVFDAYNKSTNTFLPNHTVLLEPTPIHTLEGIYISQEPGFYITDTAASSYEAPALAIWAKPDLSDGNKIVFAGDQYTVVSKGTLRSVEGKTTSQIAAQIMSDDPDLHVTVLNDIYQPYFASVTLAYLGDLSSSPSHFSQNRGYAVLSYNHGAFKYRTDRRFGIGLNRRLSPNDAWHPIIYRGLYRSEPPGGYNLGYELIYEAMEYTNQPSTTNPLISVPSGTIFSEVINEPPLQLDSLVYHLRHYPIPTGTPLTYHLRNKEIVESAIIKYIDHVNGKLFLINPLNDAGELSVSYVHEQLGYTYKELDLNPTEGHNPGISGKYVGIYMIPTRIRRLGQDQSLTLDRTVYHYIADSYTGVVNGIQSQNFVTVGGITGEPYILGILNVARTADPENLKIYDTRSMGGGLIPQPTDKYPESLMFWDLGHVDGEPYQSIGAVIVEIPEATLYTGTTPAGIVHHPLLPSGYPNPSGIYTREQQEEILKRDKPAGGFVIIEHYQGPQFLNQ